MVSLASAPPVEPARSWFDFYRAASQRLGTLVADSPFGAALSAYFLRGQPEWVSRLDRDTGPAFDMTDISATATALRGFLLATDLDRYPQITAVFRTGLQQFVAQKVPRRSPSVHWNAQLLLGMALGLGMTAEVNEGSAWLVSRMEALLKEGSGAERILAAFGLARLTNHRAIIEVLESYEVEDSNDAAVALWALLDHGREMSPAAESEVARRVQSWEQCILLSDPSRFDLPAAAAATRVALEALRTLSSPRVSGVARISDILGKFPIAVARDVHPPDDEYELQRVLWTMLAGYFPDLQDEIWLSKFGVYHPRADFAVESLRVVVEAKYTRSAADFRKVQEEITGDAASYTSRPAILDRVIAVVYDRSSSVYLHEPFRGALLTVAGIADVIVFPGVSTRPTMRGKKRGGSKRTTESASRKALRKRERNSAPI